MNPEPNSPNCLDPFKWIWIRHTDFPHQTSGMGLQFSWQICSWTFLSFFFKVNTIPIRLFEMILFHTFFSSPQHTGIGSGTSWPSCYVAQIPPSGCRILTYLFTGDELPVVPLGPLGECLPRAVLYSSILTPNLFPSREEQPAICVICNFSWSNSLFLHFHMAGNFVPVFSQIRIQGTPANRFNLIFLFINLMMQEEAVNLFATDHEFSCESEDDDKVSCIKKNRRIIIWGRREA